jgi:hypothetical protein
MERFTLKQLNEVEGKEQYHVEISDRFATFKNLDAEVDINGAWETNRENIKFSAKESVGYYELNHRKPWFDKGYSELLDQRKQAKLEWLQDPSEMNEDNLNNTKYEASGHFRNKKRQYLKDRIIEFAANSKNINFTDLYKGINEFEK